MKQRITAYILILVMIITGLPVSVFAQTGSAAGKAPASEEFSSVSRGELSSDEQAALAQEAEFCEEASKNTNSDKRVLLIQDNTPWNSNANHTVLSKVAPYDTVNTQQFMKTDLTKYSMIVFANDQKFSTYERYADLRAYLESFVKVGGVLVFGACDGGWADGKLVEELPGGIIKGNTYDKNNKVSMSSHPIVTGIYTDGQKLTNSDLVSNYCSHVYFEQNSLPAGTKTILKNTAGRPTLIEYKLGKGTVIASGLTWEHNYVYANQYGYGKFAQKSMDDLFVYGLENTSIDPKEFKSLQAYKGYTDKISVLVVDKETQEYIGNAQINVNGSSYNADSLGICYLSVGEGNADITVKASGYRASARSAVLKKGQMEVFYLEKDTGTKKPYLTLCTGNKGDGNVNLLEQQIYFTEKDKTSLSLSLSGDWGGHGQGKYILYQGSTQVSSSTNKINVNPGEKFNSESPVYVMMIAADGTKSRQYKTGIYIKKKSSGFILDDKSSKQEFSLGQATSFTIDKNMPVLGGTTFNLGFNCIPASVVISENKVKIAFGITDYKDFDTWWDDYTKKIDKACDTADKLETLNDIRKAFGGKTGSFTLSSGWGSDLSVSGYAEGVMTENGLLTDLTGKLCIGAKAKYSYNQQFIVGPVPVYFEVGGGAEIKLDASIKKVLMETGQVVVDVPITFSPFATVGGGAGINGALSVGAEGKVSLPITLNTLQERIRVSLEGSMSLKASLLFVFSAEKKIAKGTWVILDKSYAGNGKAAEALAAYNPDLAAALNITDPGEYTLQSRQYLSAGDTWYGEAPSGSSGLSEGDILADYVMPGTIPQIEEINGRKIMVFQNDNGSDDATNYVRLMYSVQQSNGGWSVPAAVWENGRGDYNAVLKNSGGELYLIWQKAKDQLAQLAAESEAMSVPTEESEELQDPEDTDIIEDGSADPFSDGIVSPEVMDIPDDITPSQEDPAISQEIDVFQEDMAASQESGIDAQDVDIFQDDSAVPQEDQDSQNDSAAPQEDQDSQNDSAAPQEDQDSQNGIVTPQEGGDPQEDTDPQNGDSFETDEDIFQDNDGSLFQDGEEKAENIDAKDIPALAAQMEIAIAKWNEGSGKFEDQQYITNNSAYDGSPGICKTSEGLTAVWVHNEANDVFGNQKSTSVIQTRTLQGNTWTPVKDLAAISQTVLTLDSSSVNGNLAVAYTADLDGNLNTANDVEVYKIFNGQTSRITNNKQGDLNAQIYGDGIYWYYNGGFYRHSFTQGNTTELFQDKEVPAGSGFKIVSDSGNTGFIWIVTNEDRTTEFYASRLTGSGWSIPMDMGKVSSTVNFYDCNLDGNGNWTIVMNTSALDNPDRHTLSCKQLQPAADLVLAGIIGADYERVDGQQPIQYVLRNDGAKAISGFTFTCYDQQTIITQKDISQTVQPGETITLSDMISIGVPEKVKDYRFVVSSSEDRDSSNNESILTLGYQDLRVDVKECYVDQKISLFVTASNETDRTVSGKLVIRDKNADGKVLLSKNITDLPPKQQYTYNYVIDKSTFTIAAGKDKSYYVSVETENEGTPSDNYKNVLIHTLKDEIFSIVLNGKTKDLVLDYTKYAKSGYTIAAETVPKSSKSLLTWKSSDTKIATVKNGKLTIKGTGNVKITATAPDKTLEESVDVHIIKSIKTAPTQVKITNKRTTQYTLTWKKVSGATNYEVLRSTSKSGKYTAVGRTFNNTFVDHTVVAGKTYYYKIRVYKNYYGVYFYGSSSAIVSAKASLPEPVITVSGSTPTQMYIRWGTISGADSYDVLRSTKKNGTYKLVGSTKNTYFYDTAIVPKTKYYYRVYASLKKVRGIGSKIVEGSYQLSAPGYFYASPQSYNSVRVYIGSSSYANGYQIYYATKEKGTYKHLKTLKTSGEYIHRSLSINKNYFYKARYYVEVKGKKYYSPFTNPQTVKTVLSYPKSFYAKAASATSISLSWDKVDGASGYEVYRSDSGYGTYKKIATVKKGTTYTNKSLKKGRYYYYKVRAYRTSGNKKYYSDYSYYSSCWLAS